MKKILVIIAFLFVVVGTYTFAEENPARVFEGSNDFTEIKGAF